MDKCVVCGALTPLLYFDGKPLCLECDDVREGNSIEMKKPPARELFIGDKGRAGEADRAHADQPRFAVSL